MGYNSNQAEPVPEDVREIKNYLSSLEQGIAGLRRDTAASRSISPIDAVSRENPQAGCIGHPTATFEKGPLWIPGISFGR